MPAFELVEDGHADYKTLDAFTLVAQNTWNGGVVLGAPVAAWRAVDLETAVTRCWVNDAPAGQGKTGDALGHPLEAVAWLANLVNGRGRMLARDMIVRSLCSFNGDASENRSYVKLPRAPAGPRRPSPGASGERRPFMLLTLSA